MWLMYWHTSLNQCTAESPLQYVTWRKRTLYSIGQHYNKESFDFYAWAYFLNLICQSTNFLRFKILEFALLQRKLFKTSEPWGWNPLDCHLHKMQGFKQSLFSIYPWTGIRIVRNIWEGGNFLGFFPTH